MNKDNAAQFLPLVQALADGKTIQKIQRDTWEDLESHSFYDEPERYRIKPEPREFKITLCIKDRSRITHYDEGDEKTPELFEVVRVREILD